MAETTHFKFPLPDPLNYADEDAERIKQAIMAVDTLLYGVTASLSCDDPAFETVQAIVNAVKSLRTEKTAVVDFEAFQDVVAEALQRVRFALESIVTNRHVMTGDQADPSEDAFYLPSGAKDGDGVDVDGLGRFCWSGTSTEPVDCETCLLATAGEGSKPGRWLLVEPDWQAVFSEILRITDWLELEKDRLEQKVDVAFAEHTRLFSEHDERLSTVTTELATVGHVLTTTATLTFPSVAAYGGRQDVTVSLPGVSVGDVVQVDCSTLVESLFPSGFVVGADVVTVRLMNAKNSAVTPASAEYRITAVGVSRRTG